jgi:hypothetical protein
MAEAGLAVADDELDRLGFELQRSSRSHHDLSDLAG